MIYKKELHKVISILALCMYSTVSQEFLSLTKKKSIHWFIRYIFLHRLLFIIYNIISACNISQKKKNAKFDFLLIWTMKSFQPIYILYKKEKESQNHVVISQQRL